MCGINGIFAYRRDASPVDESELLRTREAMVRRGPDGAGLWVAPDRRIGLGHRRLAIIDLHETGAQPMATQDGSLRVVFNGEIYNHGALRKRLESRGARFRSRSDTEVLLHLYRERGAEMVHELRGMFAFALWDERRRTLLLARDPFGVKPLYYADDGASLRFASQVKALARSGAIGLERDCAGEAGFYVWGCVPEPHTLYRRIRSIPAGHLASVTDGGTLAVQPYFRMADEVAEAQDGLARLPREEVARRLQEALASSVEHHLVADVPVSVFLSSGLDSNAILALACRDRGRALRTITLGFDEYRGTPDDETPLAEASAARHGAVHDTQWVSGAHFDRVLPAFLEAMDQPSMDGLNAYLVCEAAAASGLRVALSGLGADELFRGYSSFREVPALARRLGWARRVPRAARSLRRLVTPLLGRLASPKYAGLLEYGGSDAGAYLLRRGVFMPWELESIMGREAAQEGWRELDALAQLEREATAVRSDALRVSVLESSWYMRNQLLRDADWAGMAHSVEIRVPFVDVVLFRALLPLLLQPDPPGKGDVAKAADPSLPAAVLHRAKTGFSVPVRQWMRKRPGIRRERGLRGWVRSIGRRQTGNNRVLAFATDAYGGYGGIALYNRDLLASIASHDGCREVVALPRLMPNPPEPLPPKLTYVVDGLGGKFRYLRAAWRLLSEDPRFDLVVAGHVRLSPVAWLAAMRCRAPLLLCLYGIEARAGAAGPLARFFACRAESFVSISEDTLQRFRAWSGTGSRRATVIPNAIRLELYGPGRRPEWLVQRYGLAGRRVLMTLGRLDARERYKGFDEVLSLLPALAEKFPDIAYLIAGEGSDRVRLEARVRDEGLAARVIFTGHVPEEEKADHYRLADAFVLPSDGEGFGYVLLEAMACGIPTVASTLDGGREALRDGALGTLVDPRSPAQTLQGILEALARPRGRVPDGLDHFTYAHFERRWHALLDRSVV